MTKLKYEKVIIKVIQNQIDKDHDYKKILVNLKETVFDEKEIPNLNVKFI
jgi:hypothetical protein